MCCVIFKLALISNIIKRIQYINCQVVLGGGRRHFLPSSEPDPVVNMERSKYHRRDGLNLVQVNQREKPKKMSTSDEVSRYVTAPYGVV